MNGENQRLRGMLSQVGSNYASLQMHLVSLMQQQQQQHSKPIVLKNKRKSEEERKEDGGAMVPRQFLELAPTADEQSKTPNPSTQPAT